MTAIVDLARLASSPDPKVKLWALVLLLAVKDKAAKIRFAPGQSEATLTYTVDGVEYPMIPPPDHMAPELIEALRDLPRPIGLRTRLAWLLRRVARRLEGPHAQTPASFLVGLNGQFASVTMLLEVPDAVKAVSLHLQPDDAAAAQAQAILSAVLPERPTSDLDL